MHFLQCALILLYRINAFLSICFLQKPQNSTPGEKAPPHSAQTAGTKKGRCRSIRLFHTAQIVRLSLFLEPVFTRNMCGFSSIILLQTRQKYAGGLSVAIHPSATLLCSQAESCLERSRPASIFHAVCSKICRKDTGIRL